MLLQKSLYSKSGFVCEDGRESVRKPQSILRRIRGGRGYGSGSGSVIWESAKRQEARLKTMKERTIRLRLRHPLFN